MRISFLLLFAIALFGLNCSQTEQKNYEATVKHRTGSIVNFINDSTLACDSVAVKATGADQYGMKHYVMAFLKRGPNRNQDSATAAQLQKQHLENINRLAAEGKLIVAGPFMDDGDIRGIYVFNVSTIEEAEQLTASDPAIKAGRLTMELHPWYGSAALQWNPQLHKLVENTNVAE